MKTFSLSATLALTLALGLVQAGCGDDDDNNNDGNNHRGDSGTPYRDAGAGMDASMDSGARDDAGGGDIDAAIPQLTDSQIAGVIGTVNTGEIGQGNLASTKGTNPAIVQYATTMVAHHTTSNTTLATLLQTLSLSQADSEVSLKLKADGDAVVARLQGLSPGTNFDHEYIAAQALQHQIVLGIIDNQLLPQADNADLKAFVSMTRAVVQSHLSHATSLAASYQIGADGGAVGGPDGGTDAGF